MRARYLRPATAWHEKRLRRPNVYTPALPPTLIHRLYLASKALGRPMTRVAAEAVERHLEYLEAVAEPEDCYRLTPSGEAWAREQRRKAA